MTCTVRREDDVSPLKLLGMIVLAICLLVAIRHAWRLKSGIGERSAWLRSWAKIVSCAGAIAIIIGVTFGFRGWVLKIFIIAGLVALMADGILIRATRTSVVRESRKGRLSGEDAG